MDKRKEQNENQEKQQVKRDKKQLEEKLKAQIYFLQKSIKDYDKGDVRETARIALHLRTLLYDSKKSKSTFYLYNIKNKLAFINTSQPVTDRLPVGFCVIKTGIEFDEKTDKPKHRTTYVPLLGYAHIYGKSKFNKWWKQVVVLDKEQQSFTRETLIRYVANKDGGAHVDLSLDKDYYDLKYEGSIDIECSLNNHKCEFENDIVEASIRQIAYEVLFTLNEYNPGLLDEKYF